MTNYLYHPFTNSSLGLFVPNQASKEVTVFVLENIDLYHQPVDSPSMALTFFFVNLFLLSIQEYICFKLLRIIRKDNSLISDIATLIVYMEIAFHPFWLIFTTLTNLIHPLHILIGHWFCTFSWFFFNFATETIFFHSFIVAVMRYFFILHEGKAKHFGRKKLRKAFLTLSVLVPLVCTFWPALEGSELSIFSFINKCYGTHHRVFLIETSTLDVLKDKIWDTRINNQTEWLEMIVAILKRMSKITRLLVFFILGFNIIEGILYYKILHSLNRYVNATS